MNTRIRRHFDGVEPRLSNIGRFEDNKEGGKCERLK